MHVDEHMQLGMAPCNAKPGFMKSARDQVSLNSELMPMNSQGGRVNPQGLHQWLHYWAKLSVGREVPSRVGVSGIRGSSVHVRASGSLKRHVHVLLPVGLHCVAWQSKTQSGVILPCQR